MKKQLTSKNKQKVKVKKLALPIVASLFLFTLIIIGTISSSFDSLAGNSVINGHICPDGYNLSYDECINEKEAVKLGDVNFDSKIDNNDILLIDSHLKRETLLISQAFNAADVNGDGIVTKEDKENILSSIKGVKKVIGYACPDSYTLDGTTCSISKKASKIKHNSDVVVGDAIYYNNSYWFILSNNDDYVTAIKSEPLNSEELLNYGIYNNSMYYSGGCKNNSCNDYNGSDIKVVLDSYSEAITNDLKEVNGYKIRLITIEELLSFGFVDKTGTLYYEMNKNTPYWLGADGKEYWVMNSLKNHLNNTFMVVDYNDNSYVYESSVNSTLGAIRPVINLYKRAIK